MAKWKGEELSECTCLYTCNLLFDEALNARLKQCVEACPSIRCVAAYQEWPGGLEGFAAPYEVRCETSWSPLRSTFTLDPVLGRMVADGGTYTCPCLVVCIVFMCDPQSFLYAGAWHICA